MGQVRVGEWPAATTPTWHWVEEVVLGLVVAVEERALRAH